MTNQLFYYDGKKENIDKFFKGIDFNEFKNFDTEKIEEIEKNAKQVSVCIRNKYPFYDSFQRYARTIEIVNCSSKNYNLETDDEKVLFILSIVDPNFGMLEILGSNTDKVEIKQKIKNKFGIYDPRLVKAEIAYIKNMFKKENINKKSI